MAVLPTFKTLQASDFEPQYATLINQLATIFNNNIQSVFTTLNNGVSLADNIACQVATVPITVDANGNTTNSASFAIQTTGMRISGLTVIGVTNTTNNQVYPTGAPFCTYTPGTQNITINNITGLQTGYQWSVTVVAWASG